ncbi:PBP superfamily domain-containing protein [Yoonia tamlensis]|uniref:PBP superfamily domain-containing protein n=1 Tax=Yoonia tamlensis TaxID=390270 RepID=A0A1I6FNN3_9RHOB|nr:phosphate ABC transporter substrate-binding/OmpA family protein [Yoonia tamlensis]SFR31560.1 PBP superfamily domain-containing protein [Yoonia tamlensis]
MGRLFNKNLAAQCAISAALLVATPAVADVVLTTTDGTISLSGELLDVTEDTYVLKTDTGELRIRREFATCEGPECPSDGEEVVDETDVVTLTSSDGLITLNGRLLDYSNTEYVIETSNGSLTVRREFASCEGAACPGSANASDRFVVTVPGADGAQLVAAIIDDYTAAKDFNLTQQFGSESGLPGLLIGDARGAEVASVSMQSMNTVDAIKALVAGESQFAVTRGRATPADVTVALGRQVTDISEVLTEEIIGLDAISFVVSEDNGIDVIDFQSIQKIINGEITHWSQLGGSSQPITLHTLASNDALGAQLNARGFTGINAMGNGTIHASVDALNAAVAADPTGFGILYRSQAEGVKALNLATACNIFVDNSDFAIQTEEHPLTLRWYHYALASGTASEFARNVGQYIPTDAGQASIASRGLVTQQLQIVPMQDQGARLLSTVLTGDTDRASNNVMRGYFNQAANARRISTSLRFLSGNATLDSKAESDISRISEIVRSNEYEGYEVLVFGFSDSYGSLDANLALSERRADAVKDVLLLDNPGYLDSAAVRSYGIGPIAPVGCNETDEGREQNRRVEIWIRPRA